MPLRVPSSEAAFRRRREQGSETRIFLENRYQAVNGGTSPLCEEYNGELLLCGEPGSFYILYTSDSR